MGDKSGRVVRAALLVIGDEILSGRTRDANLPCLARWLGERGIRLVEARIVPDAIDCIASALNALRREVDYVFTTGGIGPTHDDITAEAVARAFGLPLVHHEEALRRLAAHYPPGELTGARKRMARVPEGAELIDNPVSVAPGFRIGNVFVLAGVPEIMQVMLDSLAHMLTGGRPVHSRTLGVPMSESAFADDLAAIAAGHGELQIGSYPYFRDGRPGLHVVVRGTEPAEIDSAVAEIAVAARRHGVEPLADPAEP